MTWSGVLIGAASFIIIGIFHPIVIKAEYRFGKAIWPVFLLAGIVLLLLSLFSSMPTLSAVLGVAAFSCLWSIHELFAQEKRVQKGWFPANPRRRKKRPAATKSKEEILWK